MAEGSGPLSSQPNCFLSPPYEQLLTVVVGGAVAVVAVIVQWQWGILGHPHHLVLLCCHPSRPGAGCCHVLCCPVVIIPLILVLVVVVFFTVLSFLSSLSHCSLVCCCPSVIIPSMFAN